MDYTEPKNNQNIIPLEEAAKILAVPVNTLLKWNEYNILKPTITHTGEVGYKQDQISQFLAIRQRSQKNQIPRQNPLRQEPEVSKPSRINSQPFLVTPILAFILSFSATVVSLSVTLKFIPNETDSLGAALASQISKFNLSGSTAPPLPIQLKNKIDSDNNLGNVGIADLKDRLATLNIITAGKSAKTAQPDIDLSANNIITYSQTTNFASAEDTPNNQAPISEFDSNGNIQGKTTNTDVIAAAISANGMIQAGTVKQTVDLNLLLAFLTLGLLSIPFIFKKQLAYSAKNFRGSEMLLSDPADSRQEQKIIEVNQKTDGSVVLCFQGQEYKVSKPELDSESDQFIERLMGLVTPDVKEIDYDVFTDGEIKLSAPLSKLVTRLGFVGIKRDLFFPRTSKNRVLFRRYLTDKDLASMNLSPGQITSVFLNSN